MFKIQEFDAAQAESVLPELVEQLRGAVYGGASVSFWPPLSEDEARGYWLKVLDELRAGTRRMLVARKDGTVVGSVQLRLVTVPNGRHRAEVEKLLVLCSARGQGIARALLVSLEAVARAAGRRLLVTMSLGIRGRRIRDRLSHQLFQGREIDICEALDVETALAR